MAAEGSEATVLRRSYFHRFGAASSRDLGNCTLLLDRNMRPRSRDMRQPQGPRGLLRLLRRQSSAAISYCPIPLDASCRYSTVLSSANKPPVACSKPMTYDHTARRPKLREGTHVATLPSILQPRYCSVLTPFPAP